MAVFGPSSSGGGSTVFGSSASSVGIDPLLRATPPEEPGASPFGFVGNIAEGVFDLAKGGAALIGSGIHDVGQAVGLVDDPTGYRTDDMVKTMLGFTPEGFNPLDENAIVGDIVKRWGPLVPGGEAPQETLEMMYENPVPFALDVAALGSGVSKLAGISGRSSLKAAGALGEGSVYATEVAKLAGNVAPRTARAAATRAGLEALGEGNSLVSRILPQTRMKWVEGKGLVPSAEVYNPVIRAAVAPVRRYGMTQSLDDLRAIRDAAKLGTDRMPGAATPVADVAYYDALIEKAEAAGMTRIETPWAASRNANKSAMKAYMAQKNQQYLRRDEATEKSVATLRQYEKDNPGILDNYWITSQGLDVQFDGVDYTPLEGLVTDPTGAPKRLYHGTSEAFDEFNMSRNDVGALYGPGIYMTDDPAIASGYATAESGAVAAGKTFGISSSAESATLNGADEIADFLADHPDLMEISGSRKVVEAPSSAPGTSGTMFHVETRFGRASGGANVRGGFARVTNPFDIDAPATLTDLKNLKVAAARMAMRETADASSQAGQILGAMWAKADRALTEVDQAMLADGAVTKQELYRVLEGALPNKLRVNEVLQEAGFDGITHIGGALTGNDPHQVYIAFKPEQVVGGFAAPEPGTAPVPLNTRMMAANPDLRSLTPVRVRMPDASVGSASAVTHARKGTGTVDVPISLSIPNDNAFWSDKHIDSFLLPRAGEGTLIKDLGNGLSEVADDTDTFGGGRVFLARGPRGEPVGVAAAYPNSISVAVRSDARRQGIATRLYEAMESEGVPVKGLSGRNTSAQGAALSESFRSPTPWWTRAAEAGGDDYTVAASVEQYVRDVGEEYVYHNRGAKSAEVIDREGLRAAPSNGELWVGDSAMAARYGEVGYRVNLRNLEGKIADVNEPTLGETEFLLKEPVPVRDLEKWDGERWVALGPRDTADAGRPVKMPGAVPTRPAYLDMDVTPEMVESIGPIGERFQAALKEVDDYIDDLEVQRALREESGENVDDLVEGAQLWRSDLEDSIRRRYAHQQADMPDIDQQWQLMDEQRLEEWEELSPAFRSPVGMSPRKALERALVPNRMLHGLEFDWGAKDAVRDARRELRNAKTAAKKLVDRTTQKSNRAAKSAETAARQAERALGKARDPKFKAVKARTYAAAHKQALEAPHTAAQKISDAEAKAAERIAKAEADLATAEARLEAGFSGGPGLAEVHQALRDAGRPTPVYFPHIDATNLKQSDWFAARKAVGANVYARNPHDMQMRGVLLGEGKILKDPIEVARRRSARMIREQETYHLWDMLTREYGTPVSNANQVPSGFKLVAPDMLFINYRTRMSLLDRLDGYLVDGLDSDSAMAKALKETMDENYDAVAELMEADNVKMYAVPEAVLKNLDEAAKWSPAFGGKNARLWMDTPMNLWRGLTLTASPRWIMNNVMGNTAFALMQGVKVADVVRIGYRKFETLISNWYRRRVGMPEKFGPRERSLAYDFHLLPQSENINPGFIGATSERPTRLGKAAEETAMGRAIMATQASKTGTFFRTMGEAMRSFNKTWEDTFREASFLAAAEKGQGLSAARRTARSFMNSQKRIEKILKDGFTEADGRMALDEMNAFFGNYASMTPFERHVIRRWVFPFWGFYRHSSKLLLSFPVEYPGRAIIMQGLANAHAEMMEQYGPMPDWLESAIPLGPPGTDAFLTTRGANPFSGVAEGIEGVGSMLHPVLKTGLEQVTGRDMFTGREFTDKDVVQPYGSDQQYRIVYDEAGNPIGSEPVEKVAPGFLQGLLSQIPQYDMVRDTIAGGRSYDTASVLDAIQQQYGGQYGEATPIDPETGEPFSPVGLGGTVAKNFGIPVSQYDLDAFQERLTEEQQAVLLEALRRLGAA